MKLKMNIFLKLLIVLNFSKITCQRGTRYKNTGTVGWGVPARGSHVENNKFQSHQQNGIGIRGGPPRQAVANIVTELDHIELSNKGCTSVDLLVEQAKHRHRQNSNYQPAISLNVGKDSPKCIEVFDAASCQEMSIQLLNETKKNFLLSRDNSYEIYRLLNFNIYPKSADNCRLPEYFDEKKLVLWKELYCPANIYLSISSSSPTNFRIKDDNCTNINKTGKPPKYTKELTFALSLIKENRSESICLQLYTERDCKGDVMRVIIPSCPHCQEFIHLWDYLTDESGRAIVDTEINVNSVRKCSPCLSPPKPQKPPKGTRRPEFPNSESEASDKAEEGNCQFDDCLTIGDFMNLTRTLRGSFLKMWNSNCYFFFNDSKCSTPPYIKEDKVDHTHLEQVGGKYSEFFEWSVADCNKYRDGHDTCKHLMENRTLNDVFPLEEFEKFLKKTSKESRRSALASFVDSNAIFVGIAGSLTVILLGIVTTMTVLLCWKKRKLRMIRKRQVQKRSTVSASSAHQLRTLNVHQVDSINENDYINDITGLQALIRCFAGDNYELSRASINIGNIRDSTASILGVGEFSIAFKGRLEPSGRDVAVKTMKSGQATARSMKGALKECQVFMMLGKHERIVEFIGVCIEGVRNGELFMVMEYLEKGPLRTFLITQKSHFVNLVNDEEVIPTSEEITKMAECPIKDGNPVEFNTFQLFKWCCEVADAMEFLDERGIVHVSLSAKNVLLDANFSSKISDFNLAKIPGENTGSSYNRRTQTNRLHERLIPWRWFAVESLLDDIFSTQSDIWTFGIFAWEVFTLGGTPYPEYHYGGEFTLCLKHGYRLLKPNFATIESYELMLSCWYDAPEKRPTFTRIKSRLQGMMAQTKQNEILIN